jgi:hypothetical protein
VFGAGNLPPEQARQALRRMRDLIERIIDEAEAVLQRNAMLAVA